MTDPGTTYVELYATSHFSFLRGASSPEELFAAAAALGHSALGLCDRGSVAGMVRGLSGQEATGVRLIAGTRVDLRDGRSILLYPTDRAAWSRLTRLLSLGKGRTHAMRRCAFAVTISIEVERGFEIPPAHSSDARGAHAHRIALDRSLKSIRSSRKPINAPARCLNL